GELAVIERACGVVDTAWTELLAGGGIAAGRSEREVAADLEHAMRLSGSDGVAFDTIVASGPNGAFPHHVPGDRRLAEGALAVVRPGTACADLDAVSRDIISGAGFGEYFGHSLGHGVGLDVHEAPSVSARSTSTLSDGDVITVEPGIYLPGLGGIRIEDTVAV